MYFDTTYFSWQTKHGIVQKLAHAKCDPTEQLAAITDTDSLAERFK